MPVLSALENAAWQTRINRLQNACGCGAGAGALVTSTVAVLLLFLIQPRSIMTAGWRDAGVAVVAVLGVTVLAKVVGAWHERRRWRRAVEELRLLVAARECSP